MRYGRSAPVDRLMRIFAIRTDLHRHRSPQSKLDCEVQSPVFALYTKRYPSAKRYDLCVCQRRQRTAILIPRCGDNFDSVNSTNPYAFKHFSYSQKRFLSLVQNLQGF